MVLGLDRTKCITVSGLGLAVDQPAVGGACGFHQRLGHRRVAVDDPRYLGVPALEQLGVDELLDQFGRFGADDVAAEQLAELLVADDLDQALRSP